MHPIDKQLKNKNNLFDMVFKTFLIYFTCLIKIGLSFELVPGQACSLQTRRSVDSPSHFAPPLKACCSTSRSRVWNPPPHDFVQADHSPYGPHLQSTLAISSK